jgi:hypothetical protein
VLKELGNLLPFNLFVFMILEILKLLVDLGLPPYNLFINELYGGIILLLIRD